MTTKTKRLTLYGMREPTRKRDRKPYSKSDREYNSVRKYKVEARKLNNRQLFKEFYNEKEDLHPEWDYVQ